MTTSDDEQTEQSTHLRLTHVWDERQHDRGECYAFPLLVSEP